MAAQAAFLSFIYFLSLYLYLSLFICVAHFATPRCIFCHTSLQKFPRYFFSIFLFFLVYFLAPSKINAYLCHVIKNKQQLERAATYKRRRL